MEATKLPEEKTKVITTGEELGIMSPELLPDLTDALKGPMFEPLKEKSAFSTLTVDDELETITWPNGADLAPEYLYFQAFKREPELQAQFKEWGYIY